MMMQDSEPNSAAYMLGGCMCVCVFASAWFDELCLLDKSKAHPSAAHTHTYSIHVCCNMMDSARAKGLISGSALFHWLATRHPHTCTYIRDGFVAPIVCLYAFIVPLCVLSLCAQVPILIRLVT
jgi:hypothetical protein